MASLDQISEFTTRSNSSYESLTKKAICINKPSTTNKKLLSNHRRTFTNTASDLLALSSNFLNSSTPASPIHHSTVPSSITQTPQKIPSSYNEVSSLSVSFCNKTSTSNSLSSDNITNTRRKRHFFKFLDTAIEYFKYELDNLKPIPTDLSQLQSEIHIIQNKQQEIEQENYRLMQDYSQLKIQLRDLEKDSDSYTSSIQQLSNYTQLLEQKLEKTEAELNFQRRIGREMIFTQNSRSSESSTKSVQMSRMLSSTDYSAEISEHELNEIANIIQQKEEEIQILKKHYQFLVSMKERPTRNTLSYNRNLF